MILPDGSRQEIERLDTYITHSGSVVLRIRGNTGLGFRIDYYLRDSNDVYYSDQDRWSAGVYITYDF